MCIILTFVRSSSYFGQNQCKFKVASGYQNLSMKMKTSRFYNYKASGGSIYIANNDNKNGTLFVNNDNNNNDSDVAKSSRDENVGIYILGTKEAYTNETEFSLEVPPGVVDSIVSCDGSDIIFNNQNYVIITTNIISYNSVNHSGADYALMSQICGSQREHTDVSLNNDLNSHVILEDGAVLGVLDLVVNEFDIDIFNGTIFTTGDVKINTNDTLLVALVDGSVISINDTIYDQIYQRLKSFWLNNDTQYVSGKGKGGTMVMDTLSAVYNTNNNSDSGVKNINKLLFHSLNISGTLELIYISNSEDNRNSTVTVIADTIIIAKGGFLKGNNLIPNLLNDPVPLYLSEVSGVRASESSTYGTSSNGNNKGTHLS